MVLAAELVTGMAATGCVVATVTMGDTAEHKQNHLSLQPLNFSSLMNILIYVVDNITDYLLHL